MSNYDLAIAGAGPAGSTLALLAARAGQRVLLAERSRFDVPRIGETAPPELRPLLSKLGLDHLLSGLSHVEVPAVVSVWGSDEPVERQHILSPYGAAAHLDRRAFDAGLALAAQAAGADLHIGTSVRFEPLKPNGYRVVLSNGMCANAEIVVRANGRAGGTLGIANVRCYLDDNVAAVARFGPSPKRTEARTVIEAIAGGWFYLAAIPGDQVVAVFITRASSIPAEKSERLRWWLQVLAKTSIVRAALIGQSIPNSLSIHDARSSYLQVSAGPDWFALGDARFAPDPLSGQGIIWAIEDAIFAEKALERASEGSFARTMSERTSAEVADYLIVRDRTYGSERRFVADYYWSTRGSCGHQRTSRAPRISRRRKPT
jgi:flavin-dependent dehydrogenase